MTDATKNPIATSCDKRKGGTLRYRDDDAAQRRTECLAGQEYLPMDVFVDSKTMRLQSQGSSLCGAGHEYLPMDVYVDPKTMRLHFQGSSLLDRLPRARSAAA
jgi:hypothetical protein